MICSAQLRASNLMRMSNEKLGILATRFSINWWIVKSLFQCNTNHNNLLRFPDILLLDNKPLAKIVNKKVINALLGKNN